MTNYSYVNIFFPGHIHSKVETRCTSSEWIWAWICWHYGFSQSEVYFQKLPTLKTRLLWMMWGLIPKYYGPPVRQTLDCLFHYKTWLWKGWRGWAHVPYLQLREWQSYSGFNIPMLFSIGLRGGSLQEKLSHCSASQKFRDSPDNDASFLEPTTGRWPFCYFQSISVVVVGTFFAFSVDGDRLLSLMACITDSQALSESFIVSAKT